MKKIVAGVAAAAAIVSSFALTSTASAATTPVVYAQSFANWSHPAVEPAEINVVLMSEPIVSIKWHAWTSTYAKGAGWQPFNNCKPSCAQGHVTWYRAYLTLSRVKHHGSRVYFSRMADVRTGRLPACSSLVCVSRTTIYHYSRNGWYSS